MKKTVAVLMTLLIVLSMTACGKDTTDAPAKDKESNQTTNDQADQSKEADSKPETGDGAVVSAEPKQFSIFLNFNSMPFNPEWAIWKEIANRTNVSLEGVISQSNANEEEAFSMMLSSADLADIIGYKDPAELEKLGRDGGLVALNDLIDQYAPDIKALLESDDKFRQAATSLDGNIYYIPMNVRVKSAEYYWIRQDWLDKLNLAVPTNVDELYQVLTAFRNDDPNGNGTKDEIPLFDRAGHKMPGEYLYLFNSSLSFYPKNGKLVFEPLEEDFKYAVKELSKWYKEGLIDPEIFTRGPKSRDILYGSNQAGFTHDWPSTGNYNDSLQESIPGFKNVAIAPPADQHGNVIERVTRYPVAGWSISSQAKDPETIIKFFNFFFTQEGADLINWGIEGETYTVQDGKKVFTDKVMNNPDMNPLNYLRSLGAQYRIGMNQDPEYEQGFMTEAAKQAYDLYESHPEWYPANLPPYFDGALNLKYTAEDEAEYKKIMSDIVPFVDTMFQEWLIGTSNIDDNYDQFVQGLKDRKIERAIEINQKAYETFLNY